MAEINQAYDYLMKNGTAGSSYSGAGSSSQNQQQSYQSDSDSCFNQVRIYINSGNLVAAEQLLDQTNQRTAQWFFLKGIIYQRRGWYSQAMSHLQTAVNMEPTNPEYRSALN